MCDDHTSWHDNHHAVSCKCSERLASRMLAVQMFFTTLLLAHSLYSHPSGGQHGASSYVTHANDKQDLSVGSIVCLLNCLLVQQITYLNNDHHVGCCFAGWKSRMCVDVLGNTTLHLQDTDKIYNTPPPPPPS
jgi:hypothetical protein